MQFQVGQTVSDCFGHTGVVVKIIDTTDGTDLLVQWRDKTDWIQADFVA